MATQTAATTQPTRPREIPPLWLGVAIGAMGGLHRWLPIGTLLPHPWRNVGWLLIALAMVLLLSSFRRFRVAGTHLRPFRPVKALVVEGAFRWTRNPMYLGLVVVSLGVALCLGTISPLLVPPLLLLVLDRRFVRREEEFLRDSLGTAYDDYCERVRRWL